MYSRDKCPFVSASVRTLVPLSSLFTYLTTEIGRILVREPTAETEPVTQQGGGGAIARSLTR